MPSAAKHVYAIVGWYEPPQHEKPNIKTLTPHSVAPKLLKVSGGYTTGSVCVFIRVKIKLREQSAKGLWDPSACDPH